MKVLYALFMISFLAWVGCLVHAIVSENSAPMLISCLIMNLIVIIMRSIN